MTDPYAPPHRRCILPPLLSIPGASEPAPITRTPTPLRRVLRPLTGPQWLRLATDCAEIAAEHGAAGHSEMADRWGGYATAARRAGQRLMRPEQQAELVLQGAAVAWSDAVPLVVEPVEVRGWCKRSVQRRIRRAKVARVPTELEVAREWDQPDIWP